MFVLSHLYDLLPEVWFLFPHLINYLNSLKTTSSSSLSFLPLPSGSPAPTANQYLGRRRSAAVHVATTCGSGCPSTSRGRRTIRLPSSSPSLKPLRNGTVEGDTFRRMFPCRPCRPCPPCPPIRAMTSARPRPCTSSLS